MKSNNTSKLNILIKVAFILTISSIIFAFIISINAEKLTQIPYFRCFSEREISCDLSLIFRRFLPILILFATFLVSLITIILKKIKRESLIFNEKLLLWLFIIVIPYFLLDTLFFTCWARHIDAQRQSDMKRVVTAQEMYYGINNEYFTLNYDKTDGTVAIGEFLPELHDPQSPPYKECKRLVKNADYVWKQNDIPLFCDDSDYNAEPGQWFCIYAEMKNRVSSCSEKHYFVASNRGSRVVCDNPPTITGECTCFK